MTDSYILDKVFSTLTGLNFETLFLLSICLSIGERDAIFALSEKTPLEILLFIASANGWGSTSADILTSLGRVLSVSVAFLTFIFSRSLQTSEVVALLNWNCSTVCELSKFSFILVC